MRTRSIYFLLSSLAGAIALISPATAAPELAVPTVSRTDSKQPEKTALPTVKQSPTSPDSDQPKSGHASGSASHFAPVSDYG